MLTPIERFEFYIGLGFLDLSVQLNELRSALMADIPAIRQELLTLSGVLDQITTQEAGETTVGAGQVVVAQSDLDGVQSDVQAVTAKAQALIDAAAAPAPADQTSPATDTTGTTAPVDQPVDPSAPPAQ